MTSESSSENDYCRSTSHFFFSSAQLFPDLTLSATLKEYTERDRSWSSSGALENRDVLLEILSDAMVLAPLTQLAEIQSEVNENTYFYVFTHRSAFSEYDVVKYRERQLLCVVIHQDAGQTVRAKLQNIHFCAQVRKSIVGEDLPYVLGVPLGGNTIHLKTQYDQKEKRLSETMMTYWSNFAKTG